MAYASDIRGARAHISLSDRIAGFRAELAERRAKYAVYRRTLEELSQLGDRELADLGVHRSSIKSIAAEAAYGK